MVASTNNLVMEKQQTLQQEAILKCPRCDSSNTKFCYYNNYSLSQPRHFCKACKRYWTRGGTLRNVPVGGGCRKNKRVKKAAAVAGGAVVDSLPPLSTPMTTTTTNPNSSSSHSQIDRISSLFYGVNSNISSSDHNLSFSRYNSRVDTTLFDLQQPQVNVIGFSSPSLIASTDVATPNSMFSNYVTSPMLRSSNSSVSANMASLFNSNLESQKSIDPQNNIFGLVPNYADMQMEGNTNFQNRLNQIEATNDPNSSLFSVGGWFDSSNISYSVPSLI